MRKVWALITALVLLFVCVCTVFADSDAGTVTFEGETGEFSAFKSVKAMKYHFNVKLNYDWFVYGDNTVYYSDLAQLACTASCAIYADTGTKEEGATAGYSTEFFQDIGFKDAEKIRVTSENGLDVYDGTTAIMCHQKVTRGGKPYEIVFVTVKGSLSLTDWASNFDVGADTEAYYALTGEHPEWPDCQKSMHKGFAVTANRTKTAIDKYVEKNTDAQAEKIILLTGHSRGASVANILGTFYQDDEAYLKSFTYTFAAAATTTVSQEEAAKYNTIFNVVNTDDLVTSVPLPDWNGFKLYGNSLRASGTAYADMINALAKNAYVSANGSELAKNWLTLATSREELYEMDYSDKTLVDKGSFLLKSTADLTYNSLKSTFEDDGNSGYVDIKNEKVKSGGVTKYHVYFNFCPAYALHLFSELLTSDSITGAVGTLANYPLSDTYKDIFTGLVPTVKDLSIFISHIPSTYYCMASDNFGYDQAKFLQPPTNTASIFTPMGTVGTAVTIAVGLAAVAVAVVVAKKKKRSA